MTEESIQKTRAYPGLPLGQALFYRFVWFFWQSTVARFYRVNGRNTQAIPREGPFLLLANHSAALDPFWVGSPMWRPLRFMAATSLLAIPFAGKFLMMMGAFPKQKFVKDADSMATLYELYNRGLGVVIFPEGDRTWDGRLNPVPPGIGRLIKRMGARVVYARMTSAHLAQPRWADHLRWVPLDIEYEGPFEYGPELSADEIAEEVKRRIATVPRRDQARLAWGWRIADGLQRYLWACPACFQVDGLVVERADGSVLRCTACRCGWRLDLDNNLRGLDGGQDLDVRRAADLITDHFGTPPVFDPARTDATGVVMQDSTAQIVELQRGQQPTPVAEGIPRLSTTRISVVGEDGQERWGEDLADLDAFTIEVKHQVFLRARGKLWRLEIPQDVRLRWGLVGIAWYRHLRPLR